MHSLTFRLPYLRSPSLSPSLPTSPLLPSPSLPPTLPQSLPAFTALFPLLPRFPAHFLWLPPPLSLCLSEQSLSRPPLSSRPPAGPHDREKEERRRAKLLGLSSSYLPPTFLTEPVRAPSLDTSFSPMALSEHTNATAPTELSMLGSTTGSLASTLHRLPPLEGAPSDFLQFPDLPPVPMSASRDRPIPGSPMGSSHSQARPVPFTHHDDKGELMSHMDLLREERFRIREQRLQQQQYNLALHHHLLRTEQEVRALDRKKAKTHPAELARLWLTYKKEEAEQKESERAITQQIALSVSSDPMATLLCNREFNGRDPDAAEETPARAPSPGHRQPRRQKRGTSGVDRAVRPYLHSVGAPLARRVEKVVKATTAAKATSDPAAAPPHRSNKAPLRKKPKQQSEPPAQSEDIPALARRTFLECWARVGLAVPEDPAVLFAPPAPTAKARQDPRKVACAETLQRAVRRWIARRRTKQLHEARDLEEQRDIADELEDMMDDPKFVGLLDY